MDADVAALAEKIRETVTVRNDSEKKNKKAPVDWDSFVILSERGKNVGEYMKEMRENDRL